MADNPILNLYRNDPHAGPRDIAQEAYKDAIAYLKQELKDDKKALVLLDANNSMLGFKREVERAKAFYELKHPKGRCVSLLRKLSSRIVYYSKVMDVLAQHHPEYVSLAWGAIKLVLIGIINHETLLTRFSNALVEIGNELSKAELGAELYQTDQMKEATSRLYAHIMLFFRQAVRWYSRSKIGRAVSAIVNPVELEHEETLQHIQSCAKAVNDIATSATRVETRDIHGRVQHIEDKLHQIQEGMMQMQQSLEEKADMNLQVASTTHSLTHQISVSVTDIQPRIHDLQFASVLSILTPRQLPSTALTKIQSITYRASISSVQFKNARSAPELMAKLRTWMSTPGSSLFDICIGLRAETKSKEFAADVISLLKEKQFRVFFNISQLGAQDEGWGPTLTPLFKSLIFQALEQFPDILTSKPWQLNVAKFATKHTEAEWRSLLFKIFTEINHCFVIIEAQELLRGHQDNLEWIAKFMLLWHELINQATRFGRSIKILVIGYSNTRIGGEDSSEAGNRPSSPTISRITSIIDAPTPVPRRLRRGINATARMKHLQELRRMRPGF